MHPLDNYSDGGNLSYRMTDDQYARLSAAFQQARDAIDRRTKVVSELHAEGVSLRAIAEAVGMTHPGIRKMLTKDTPT